MSEIDLVTPENAAGIGSDQQIPQPDHGLPGHPGFMMVPPGMTPPPGMMPMPMRIPPEFITFKGKNFWDACREGNLPVVYMLADQGVGVNSRDRSGFTPLHWAAYNGHFEVVDFLLRKGADPHALSTDGEAHTPLMWACMHGHIPTVRIILAAVKNVPEYVNLPDNRGYPALFHAAQFGHTLLVHFLRTFGQADCFWQDTDGHTAAHWAAFKGHLQTLKYLVEECGVCPSVLDNTRRTALHWAAKQGNLRECVYVMGGGSAFDFSKLRSGAYEDVPQAVSAHLTAHPDAYLSPDPAPPTKDPQNPSLIWCDPRDKDLENCTPMMLARSGLNEDLASLLEERVEALGGVGGVGGRVDQPSTAAGGRALTALTDRDPLALLMSKMGVKIGVSLKRSDLHAFLSVYFGLIAIFVCLSFFPLWLSLPIFGGVAFKIVKLASPTRKSIQESPYIFPAIYLASVTAVISVFFSYLAPGLALGSFTTFLWASIFVFVLALYYQCSTSDPGNLPRSEKEKQEMFGFAEKAVDASSAFCSTCWIRKPLRSKHCRSCDRCVGRFDHHCIWISNCVGYKNHRVFMLFVYLECFAQLATAFMSFVYLRSVTPDELTTFWTQFTYALTQHAPVFWITLCYNLFIVAGILFLAVSQTNQIMNNITTNEGMAGPRYPWLAVVPAGNGRHRLLNAFNRGVKANFLEIFNPPADTPDWSCVYDLPRWAVSNMELLRGAGGPGTGMNADQIAIPMGDHHGHSHGHDHGHQHGEGCNHHHDHHDSFGPIDQSPSFIPPQGAIPMFTNPNVVIRTAGIPRDGSAGVGLVDEPVGVPTGDEEKDD